MVRMICRILLIGMIAVFTLTACDERTEDEPAATPVREDSTELSASDRGGGGGFSGFGDRRTKVFTDAAEKLEVTVEELIEAVGIPPDLEAASEKLGITLDKIQEAIQSILGGFQEGGRQRGQ